MTVLMPEFFQTQKYAAQRLRQAMFVSGITQEGISNFGDFKVSQRGAGANMSVDVAAGDAWVQGDTLARQGVYHVGNDGVVNLAIAASHATLPRLDQVVLKVNDSTVVGGGDSAVLEVIAGTPTGGSTLANRSGAAALPASALRLADITVPATSTSVVTANIGNPKDPRVGAAGYPAGSLSSLAEAPPPYAYGRPVGYVPAVEAVRSALLSVVTENLVAVPFTAADVYDLEAMHDTVTNNTRLVCKTPGFYAISGQMMEATPIATNARITIAINGVTAAVSGAAATTGSASLAVTSAAICRRLAYGDYAEVWVQHTSGANREFAFRAQMIWQGP